MDARTSVQQHLHDTRIASECGPHDWSQPGIVLRFYICSLFEQQANSLEVGFECRERKRSPSGSIPRFQIGAFGQF